MKKINITAADKDGNYFVVKDRAKNLISIHLYLNKEAKSRELGVVDTSTRVFKTVRNPDKHLFRKNNAYGFNEHMIKTAKKFDFVHLVEQDGNEYLFPKSLIEEKGSYLHFKSEGFERQLFLTIYDLQPFKVPPVI